jgi:rhodanese-related sulfurtransferase
MLPLPGSRARPAHANAATRPLRLDAAGAAAWLPGASVLDARAEAAFAAGHVAGAGRMSADEFGARRPELPPRTARVLVVHDEPAQAHAAALDLVALDYREVAWLDAPLGTLPGGHASREPGAVLWRPSPFLAAVRERLKPGRALDFASGAGREAVHLALHGWQVEAWDHDNGALERAVTLAARAGVTVATRVIDLERVQDLPAPRPWDTIVVCRYLHRASFPWLEGALSAGGTLVYETFRRGQEVHGHPRQARFLLEPGELASAFPSLRIERYEESEPAGGPVMAHLLARRPEDGTPG